MFKQNGFFYNKAMSSDSTGRPIGHERSGFYVRHETGYRAFHPIPLPPNPPVQFDTGLIALLTRADRALGRLDGAAALLPNADLFVAMYVKHEAVLSSQIEGTQSTLEDLLEHEAEGSAPRDVGEVVNYVSALNYGLERLEALPLSLRLIREIHERLMRGVRGAERSPGEFRRSQNWIGPSGSSLATATFVPPPVDEMKSALHHLEAFFYEESELPILIRCALIHAQFETIHPFLDGNGRLGRLLIVFLLCQEGILQRPLLYLSAFLKQHRAEYYDRLTAIRSQGDWEGWIRFFLRGVDEVSREAHTTARSILDLRERYRGELSGRPTTLRLFDTLFEKPVLTIRQAANLLNCTFPTASTAIKNLQGLGILDETTGGARNRRYRFTAYLQLFAEVSPLRSNAAF